VNKGLFELIENNPFILSRTSRNQKGGHCEERSDVAIQMISLKAFLMAGLPRFARNDIH